MESVASLLSIEKRDEISRYANQFIKARGDTDRAIHTLGQNPRTTKGSTDGNILDGYQEQDYAKSFSLLLEMIDREQDEYRGDLQQLLFPLFIVLHLTMIAKGFEDGAQKFWDSFAELF